MADSHFAQLEYGVVDGNVFAAAPTDPAPAAGNVLDIDIFHYIPSTYSESQRLAVFQARKLSPVWTVGIEVKIDETDVVESITSEILEPNEAKRKRFSATRFVGTTVIANELTPVLGVVGRTFAGVVEFPSLSLDEPDLPALLHSMGKLPASHDALAVTTNQMKPHQVKKIQKLRDAQEKSLVGEIADVMQALRRVIPAHDDIPESRSLIPTLQGWRSW